MLKKPKKTAIWNIETRESKRYYITIQYNVRVFESTLIF